MNPQELHPFWYVRCMEPIITAVAAEIAAKVTPQIRQEYGGLMDGVILEHILAEQAPGKPSWWYEAQAALKDARVDMRNAGDRVFCLSPEFARVFSKAPIKDLDTATLEYPDSAFYLSWNDYDQLVIRDFIIDGAYVVKSDNVATFIILTTRNMDNKLHRQLGPLNLPIFSYDPALGARREPFPTIQSDNIC